MNLCVIVKMITKIEHEIRKIYENDQKAKILCVAKILAFFVSDGKIQKDIPFWVMPTCNDLFHMLYCH